MNEDKYQKAEQLISNLDLYFDDVELLNSVINRARYLEKEVLKKQQEIDKYKEK